MSEPFRVDELLATRATQALTGDEAMELHTLLADSPNLDSEDFDLAAAAIDLAFDQGADHRGLPDHLRSAIEEQATAHFAADLSRPAPVVPLARPTSSAPRRSAAGPWIAAAAAGLLALIGWWPRLTPATPEAPAATAQELRAALLESGDAVQLDWQATDDAAAAGAGGDVVWSDAGQEGYLRITGLAANDPSAEQYQLWIFDPSQDERFPVDGGVFDIPTGAVEAVVPIRAKIAVEEPFLFAVTVEKPGGVVVSSRERIVLLAQV